MSMHLEALFGSELSGFTAGFLLRDDQISFRASVSAEVLLKQLLRHMRIAGCREELLMLCSSTIANFDEEEANRRLLLKHKGPEVGSVCLIFNLQRSCPRVAV